MSKSIAVLGLGKFGRSLAENLYSLGMDLMVVDRDPEVIREFASKSTTAAGRPEDRISSAAASEISVFPLP